MRTALAIALALLPSVLAGCEARPATGASANPNQPNVIFIVVDTLRADRLGSYGDPRGLSPFVDGLAKDGVLFERAVSASSWTLPSVASYFSGFYPTVHKLTSYQKAIEASRVVGSVPLFAERFTTLAEAMRANGYETAAFSANPFIVAKYGFSQGFDHFDSTFADNATPGSVVNQAALQWLATRDRSKPFFLYLHYMDVHDPYFADERFVEPLIAAVEQKADKRLLTDEEKRRHRPLLAKCARQYLKNPRHQKLFGYADYWQARYDSGVPQINLYLSQLQAKLSDMGIWDDAFVIFTADHGESLGEHLVWAHGLSAHQDQLYVPLILRWTGHIPAGKRVSQTVRLFDLYPTLLAALSLPTVDGLQARSLTGFFENGARAPLPALGEAVKEKPLQKAFVLEQWKLLAHLDENRFELFNLDDDPTEQNDLAAKFPQRVEDLRAMLLQQLEDNEALARGVAVEMREVTQEEMDRLQALGYMEEAESEAPSSQPGPP